MFNGFTKILLIAVVGACVGLWLQYQKISHLKAEHQAQAHIIISQSQTIKQLQADIKRNQQLALEISKQESAMRSKANEVIKSIPIQVKQSEPFNAVAPQSIVDFLQQP